MPRPSCSSTISASPAIDPRTISYVESAANGSALGDPIEINALTKAFREFTGDQGFCAIGSVKSNIGHAEAASGMSQLTKVILQLQHGLLVPSIKAEPLNPNLSFDDSPFYLQRQLSEWRRPVIDGVGECPRRATVSSIGAGGYDAHLIIEEYVGERSEQRSLQWPAERYSPHGRRGTRASGHCTCRVGRFTADRGAVGQELGALAGGGRADARRSCSSIRTVP